MAEFELLKIKEINKNNNQQIKVIQQIIKIISDNEKIIHDNITSLYEYINMMDDNYDENLKLLGDILKM
jgi:hypothetical protein